MKRKRVRRRSFFLFFCFFVCGFFLLSIFILSSDDITSDFYYESPRLIAPDSSSVSVATSGNVRVDELPLLSQKTVGQGGVFYVEFPTSSVSRVVFNGKAFSGFDYGVRKRVIFGVPATLLPGSYDVLIYQTDGARIKEEVLVSAVRFPLFDLGIPASTGLNEELLVKGLSENKTRVSSALSVSPPKAYFSKPFGLPLRNNRVISSVFGEIRKTGSQTIRHLGVDIVGPEGEPVSAMNDGVVRAAYMDSVYGNSIIIDHGVSIVSMYLHLKEIGVEIGESVTRGQVIGTLGTTGYSTAPHLHLSVKVGDVSVDPLRFTEMWR